jgi:hypothetical protein
MNICIVGINQVGRSGRWGLPCSSACPASRSAAGEPCSGQPTRTGPARRGPTLLPPTTWQPLKR